MVCVFIHQLEISVRKGNTWPEGSGTGNDQEAEEQVTGQQTGVTGQHTGVTGRRTGGFGPLSPPGTAAQQGGGLLGTGGDAWTLTHRVPNARRPERRRRVTRRTPRGG